MNVVAASDYRRQHRVPLDETATVCRCTRQRRVRAARKRNDERNSDVALRTATDLDRRVEVLADLEPPRRTLARLQRWQKDPSLRWQKPHPAHDTAARPSQAGVLDVATVTDAQDEPTSGGRVAKQSDPHRHERELGNHQRHTPGLRLRPNAVTQSPAGGASPLRCRGAVIRRSEWPWRVTATGQPRPRDPWRARDRSPLRTVVRGRHGQRTVRRDMQIAGRPSLCWPDAASGLAPSNQLSIGTSVTGRSGRPGLGS